MSIINKNFEFKLGKSILYLLLLQLLIYITVGILVYLFIDVFKIILESGIAKPLALGYLPPAFGSMIFGYRMEKKYPRMLEMKKIQKLALIATIFHYILGVSDVVFLSYPLNQGLLMEMFNSAIIIYFIMIIFISLGIKQAQRNQRKLLLN